MGKLAAAAAVALLLSTLSCVSAKPKPATTEATTTTMAPENNKMAPGINQSGDANELMMKCNETYKISIKSLEELNTTGRFEDEKDDTAMCYLHCVFDMASLMDTSGKFDAERIKTMYLATRNNEHDLDEMVDMCIKQRDETDQCRRVYGFVKCLMTEEISRRGDPKEKKGEDNN